MAEKPETKNLNIFERYLTVWVALCIVGGIVLGKVAPGVAQTLDGMAIMVDGAPVVSIPIAVALFFMMYPIMVKIDFAEVVKAGKSPKPVLLTLIVNWCIKPFTMFAIAWFFLGVVFRGFIPGTRSSGRHRGRTLPLLHFRGDSVGHCPCTAMVLMWAIWQRATKGIRW